MKYFWSKVAEIDAVIEERRRLENQFQQKKSQAEKMAREISSLVPEEIKNSSLNLLKKYLPDFFGVNVEQCDVNFSVLSGDFNGVVFIKVFEDQRKL